MADQAGPPPALGCGPGCDHACPPGMGPSRARCARGGAARACLCLRLWLHSALIRVCVCVRAYECMQACAGAGSGLLFNQAILFVPPAGTRNGNDEVSDSNKCCLTCFHNQMCAPRTCRWAELSRAPSIAETFKGTCLQAHPEPCLQMQSRLPATTPCCEKKHTPYQQSEAQIRPRPPSAIMFQQHLFGQSAEFTLFLLAAVPVSRAKRAQMRTYTHTPVHTHIP
eukprot:1154703-Pelagomonas_calceolata.AAC.1